MTLLLKEQVISYAIVFEPIGSQKTQYSNWQTSTYDSHYRKTVRCSNKISLITIGSSRFVGQYFDLINYCKYVATA